MPIIGASLIFSDLAEKAKCVVLVRRARDRKVWQKLKRDGSGTCFLVVDRENVVEGITKLHRL